MGRPVVDMVGRRYGRLVGIEPAGSDRGHLIWRFRCDCGETASIRGKDVRSGKTSSCGCYHSEASANRSRDRRVPLDQRWTVDPATGCWEWNGRLDEKGYGRLDEGDRSYLAHRYVWEIHSGIFLDDPEIHLRHLCHNRRCVNPAHTTPGTAQDNIDDMISAGRHWSQRRRSE